MGLRGNIKTHIKNICKTVAGRSTAFKNVYDNARLRNRKKRYDRFATLPINKKLVLFEAFMGRKYADSPKAIYEYMLNDPKYSDYEFVWFFRERCMEQHSFLENNARTKVVLWCSPEYYKLYATSAYWITNSRLPSAIAPREGQKYIQCWHGTPLKKLGFDIEVDASDAKNDAVKVRQLYEEQARKFSYMISPSAYCSEKYISAFNLKALGKDDIVIEEGYPRNDDIVNHSPEDVDRIRKSLGIPSGRKVILYAPTWRENQHSEGIGYMFDSPIHFDRMRAAFGEEYVVLFRAHYFIANSLNLDEYDDFVIDVCDYPDINDLYIISDILVTDYSSVFFDYGILKRPVIFYMYDLEYYRDELRGFYISTDELPGPIVEDEDTLFKMIRDADTWAKDSEYMKRYENFTHKFTYLDDGHASERVVKKIFG